MSHPSDGVRTPPGAVVPLDPGCWGAGSTHGRWGALGCGVGGGHNWDNQCCDPGDCSGNPPPRTRTPSDCQPRACGMGAQTHRTADPPLTRSSSTLPAPFCVPVPTSDSFRCPLKSSRPLGGGCAGGCPIRALHALGFGFGVPPAASSIRCALRAPPRTWGSRLAPRPPAPIGCCTEGAGLEDTPPHPVLLLGGEGVGLWGCWGAGGHR